MRSSDLGGCCLSTKKIPCLITIQVDIFFKKYHCPEMRFDNVSLNLEMNYSCKKLL